MSEKQKGDRSVSAGRDINNSVIVTGDRNTVKATLSDPSTVDIGKEIAALKDILAQVGGERQASINAMLDEVQTEVAKPEAKKDFISDNLERALNLAKKVDKFATVVETLRPHVTNVVSWLGEHGYKLLPLVGLGL